MPDPLLVVILVVVVLLIAVFTEAWSYAGGAS